MVEIIGDPIAPSSIRVPTYEDNSIKSSGNIFVSGNKLMFIGAAGPEIVTSVA